MGRNQRLYGSQCELDLSPSVQHPLDASVCTLYRRNVFLQIGAYRLGLAERDKSILTLLSRRHVRAEERQERTIYPLSLVASSANTANRDCPNRTNRTRGFASTYSHSAGFPRAIVRERRHTA